jgi:hypothetical protein
VFFLLLDLPESSISDFISDKVVNYEFFNKKYYDVFKDVKIRFNNNDEPTNIYKYKLLCFVIYYFCGMLIKTKLFKSNDVNIKNDELYVKIINTFIHLLNSILKSNTHKDKNFMYSIFVSKFYLLLNKVFIDLVVSEQILN